jgi:hypothetical protein
MVMMVFEPPYSLYQGSIRFKGTDHHYVKRLKIMVKEKEFRYPEELDRGKSHVGMA